MNDIISFFLNNLPIITTAIVGWVSLLVGFNIAVETRRYFLWSLILLDCVCVLLAWQLGKSMPMLFPIWATLATGVSVGLIMGLLKSKKTNSL